MTGLSGPSALVFSPKNNKHNQKYLVFVSTSNKTNTSRRLRTTMDGPGIGLGSAATSSMMASASTTASTAPTAATTTTTTTTTTATTATSSTTNERQLCSLDLSNFQIQPLLRLPSKRRFDSEASASSNHSTTSSASASSTGGDGMSLEERLRRERQRLHSSGGLTQFSWCWYNQSTLRLLVPIRGSLYVQDGMDSYLKLVYDKHSLDHHPSANVTTSTGAIDPQLSPDGQLLAFCVLGEIFVASCAPETNTNATTPQTPTQITFGADLDRSITHGLADFVAQEEMDRYRGFWWAPDSAGILFAQVDESQVPPYRITHHENHHSAEDSNMMYEDHRYPFAGKANPSVKLGYVPIHVSTLIQPSSSYPKSPQQIALEVWGSSVVWFDPPREASEYLARVTFLPDGSACAQWQNRNQNCLVMTRMDFQTGKAKTLLVERSDVWINLHHMFHVLDYPIHPKQVLSSSSSSTFYPSSSSSSSIMMETTKKGILSASSSLSSPPPPPTTTTATANPLSHVPYPLPEESFSFLFCSERTGFAHLYLYTYVPGYNNDQAMLLRQLVVTRMPGGWQGPK